MPEQTEVERIIEHLKGSVPLWDSDAQVFTVENLMSFADRYSFLIRWSDEDSSYVVTCAEFPGLSAFGPTRADAIREGEVALGLFVETLTEANETLPEPCVVEVSR